MHTQHLKIEIKENASQAPNYNETTEFKGAVITKAIIVANGTTSGKSTVDLQIETDDGKKYVTMIGENLIVNLAAAMQASRFNNGRKNKH